MTNALSIEDEKKLILKLRMLIESSQSKGKTIRTDKREVVFTAGENALGLYYVNKGRVSLIRNHSRTTEAVVRTAGHDDFIGLKSLVLDQPYSNTARALEASELWYIPKNEFIRMVRNDIQLSNILLLKLCRGLEHAEDHIADLKVKDVRQRLATTLLFLAEQPGPEQGKIINNMDRKDLAAIIGTRPETLSREIGKFVGENLIGFRENKIIELVHLEKLVKIANIRD